MLTFFGVGGTLLPRKVPVMNQKQELKDRVESKRLEIESRIAKLRADARSDSRDEIERLQKKLDEVQKTVKSGWDQLGEDASKWLNRWLRD